jgi:hypothetical protein
VSPYTAGIKIGALMARRALHADSTEAAWASHNKWLVWISVVPLRTIARRVAIHAPGMLNHFAGFGEKGNRSVLLVRDA